jgi:hypothetical protein
MAEVIHVFERKLVVDGTPYIVQVCGRAAGNIWEGWIEFLADGDVRRTRRETTQPDRSALEYWAGGLSQTYLEGAFARTFEEPSPVREAVSRPYFEGPAPVPAAEAVEVETAILDPFSVAEKGEVILRQELSALAAWHLHNIVRAYELADESMDVERLTRPELVDLIVSKVQPV